MQLRLPNLEPQLDGGLEESYREHFLREDLTLWTVIVGLSQILLVAFAYSDYLLFGWSKDFYLLGLARSSFFVYCLAVSLVLWKTESWVLFDRLAFSVSIFAAVLTLYIDSTRPASYTGHLVVDVTIVVIFYLIWPNTLLFRALPPLLFSMGSVLLACYKIFPTPLSLYAAMFSFLSANVVGLVVSMRINNYRRGQFKAQKELEKANEVLEAVQRVQIQFISHTSGQELFRNLLLDILTLTNSEFGFIGEVLPTEAGHLLLRNRAIADISWDEESRTAYQKFADENGLEFHKILGSWGTVIQTGEPLISNDPANDPRQSGMPEGHPPIHSFLGLPFVSEGKVIGMTGIANRPDGYDMKLVDFLQPYVTTCANLIEAYRNADHRRRFEERLAQSEERFRTVFQTSPDAVCINRLGDGVYIDVNSGFSELTGFTRDEVIGKSSLEISIWHNPKDRQLLIFGLEEWGHVSNLEVSFVRKDGQVRTGLMSARIIHLNGGPHVLSVTRDVEDWKKDQLALQETTSLLNSLVEALPDVIYFRDAERKHLRVNKAFEDFFGASGQDVIGKTVEEFALSDKAVQSRKTDEAVVATKAPVVAELSWVDQRGETRIFETRKFPILDAKKDITAIGGISRDITERKQAQEELRKSNRALMALGSCGEALVSAEDEHKLLEEICRVVVEVAGYRLAWVGYADSDDFRTVRPVAQNGYDEGYLETVNITWADVERGRGPTGTAIRTGKPSLVRNTCGEPRFDPWKTEALKRGYGSCIALPLIAQGEAFGAISIYAPEPDAFDEKETRFLERLADNLSFGIQTLREREKRKRAEAEIKASLKEKEVLLREIHHRVKNNLAVIQGLLRIQSNHIKNEELSRILEDARIRIQSMAFCHELLYQSENLTSIETSRYMGNLLRHLKASFSIIGKKIEIKHEMEEVHLSIDMATPLGFILTELISNCYKHAFPGSRHGEIAVSLKRIGPDDLELRVKDDGIGLPEDKSFEESKSLGYHLMQLFVKQLKGRIEIIRQKGTEVRVSFPLT